MQQIENRGRKPITITKWDSKVNKKDFKLTLEPGINQCSDSDMEILENHDTYLDYETKGILSVVKSRVKTTRKKKASTLEPVVTEI